MNKELEKAISAVQTLLDLGETPETEPLLKGLVHTVKQPYDACVDGHKPVTGFINVLRPDIEAIKRRLRLAQYHSQQIPGTTRTAITKYRTTWHNCQCRDYTHRGGSYIDPNGGNVCKHMAQVRAMTVCEAEIA